MSAHQAVCHLADSFRMCVGGKTASPATGLAQRTIVKWTALYAPLRWPPEIKTRPEVDQEVGGTPPAVFAEDVAELVRLMAVFRTQAESVSSSWPPHPIFGRMSQRAWLRWGYLHMDHHLRQFGA